MLLTREVRMKLIIIRHGETAWTLTGQFTGSTELTLTANGRHQAESLSQIMRGVLEEKTPLVYSSPRERALETARLVLPVEVPTVEPLLVELGYGDYEGRTPGEVRNERPGWNLWDDGCPCGESFADVSSRADEFLRTRVPASDETPVVVVTHGNFTRILAARALGLRAQQGRLFASATASVSVIEDHRGERCIGLWNASADVVYANTD